MVKKKRTDEENSSKRDIISKLKKNIDAIKNFGVRKIGLFGSVAKEEANIESDIDILVEFDEGSEKFSNLINLYFFLQDLLDRKIDLVTSKSISPYIAPYILKEVEYIEELS